MKLEALKKGLLFSSGAVGTSVGGVTVHEQTGGSIGAAMRKEGYHYAPLQGDLKATESILNIKDENAAEGMKKYGFKFTNNGCIKGLFPSLEDVTDDLDTSSGTPPNLNLNENFDASYACFGFDFSHWQPTQNGKRDAGLIARAELAVKNKEGTEGIAIQNVITSLAYSKKELVTYRIFKMKKEGGNWKLVTALMWDDYWLFSGTDQVQKYRFSSPFGWSQEIIKNQFCQRGGISTSGRCADDNAFGSRAPSSTHRYAAVWESSSSPEAKQSIFEAVKVASIGTDEEMGSFWGRNVYDTSNSGFGLGYYYDKDTKKWLNANDEDSKEFLNPLFKNKGTWESLDSFCYSWKGNDQDRWRDLCYRK